MDLNPNDEFIDFEGHFISTPTSQQPFQDSFHSQDSSSQDSSSFTPRTPPLRTPQTSTMTTAAERRLVDPQRIGNYFEVGTDHKAVRFSGGGLHSKPQVGSVGGTSLCYRPDHTDLKAFQANEKSCTTPLGETFRLELTSTKKGPAFTAWINDVLRHFIKHGLDSTAYVLKPAIPGSVLDITSVADTKEFFLLSEWGSIDKEAILVFDKAIIATTCPIDKINNTMACEFLRGSVSLEMKRLLDQGLALNCSAALMLWTIIHKVQGTNSTAGRQIQNEIIAMRLTSTPGYDVDVFASVLHTACTNLAGLGTMHLPTDFSMLVSSCFDTTGILEFDLEIAGIKNALDNNPSAHSWDDIITSAQAKFNVLQTTKRWPPLLTGQSKAAEGAFAVELRTLHGEVSQLRSSFGGRGAGGGRGTGRGGRGTPGGGAPKDYSGDSMCRYCKATDHKMDTCAKLIAKNKAVAASGGARPGPPSDSKTRHWRSAPRDGEPNVKVALVDGKSATYTYCGTCKRWRTGPGSHLTAQHVVKQLLTTTPGASAAAASIPAPSGIDPLTNPWGLWCAPTVQDPGHTQSIVQFYED